MLRKFINLLLYSNLWIALAAGAMVWQSDLLFRQEIKPYPYLFFVASATLCLYAIHRLVGIQKVAAFTDKGRFQVIWEYRHHIAIYAGLASLVAAYSFWQLPRRIWFPLFVPIFLSLAYVLPMLGQGRRLRDLHYIKIFLVAITWAWLTALLPAIYWGHWPNLSVLLTTCERACFIFAITIPFDIRDMRVDSHTKVRTLPTRFGTLVAKRMAYFALLLMAIFIYLNFLILAYSLSTLLILYLTIILSAYCIYYSDQTEEDYFFTGLVDGLMIIQFLLLYLGHSVVLSS